MKTHSAFQETPLDKCNEELIHCSLYGSTWFVSWIFTQFFPRFVPFHIPHLFSSFNYSEHHFASLDSIQLFLFADRRVLQFPVFFILEMFFHSLYASLCNDEKLFDETEPHWLDLVKRMRSNWSFLVSLCAEWCRNMGLIKFTISHLLQELMIYPM